MQTNQVVKSNYTGERRDQTGELKKRLQQQHPGEIIRAYYLKQEVSNQWLI